MSIQRETRKSDGKTVYAVRWKDPATGRHRSKRFSRKADAERHDLEMRRAAQTGELGPLGGDKETLADFGREWFRMYAREHLEKATQRTYAGSWDRHILPRLGDHTLRRLSADPRIIQAFAVDLREDGVGPEAVRTALVVLQSALQRAVEWNRISDNPVSKIRKPGNRTKRKATPMPPAIVEELRAYFAERNRPRDATLISVLAYAGLRPGEALALRWRNIRRNTIHVDGAIADGARKSTKTGASRSVRLLAPLADDLAAWRAACAHDSDDDLVFPSSTGGYWTLEDYKNWQSRPFRRACERIGLGRFVDEQVTSKATGKARTQKRWLAATGDDPGPRPYDLRHAFVSLLIHEGLSVVEVASQAGHSPEMTLNTYAHVIAEFDPVDRRPAADHIQDARAGRDYVLRAGYVSDRSAPGSETSRASKNPRVSRGSLVKPMSGLEPLTPSLRVKCSTS